MARLRQQLFRLRALFLKRHLETDMAEEMQAHLEMEAAANERTGTPPNETRYTALRQFGNLASIQERARDQRGWAWLGELGRDIHFTARSLRRSFFFSLAVVGTLAFCVGANTAILSALYGLILKPLPFRKRWMLVVGRRNVIDLGRILTQDGVLPPPTENQ